MKQNISIQNESKKEGNRPPLHRSLSDMTRRKHPHKHHGLVRSTSASEVASEKPPLSPKEKHPKEQRAKKKKRSPISEDGRDVRKKKLKSKKFIKSPKIWMII